MKNLLVLSFLSLTQLLFAQVDKKWVVGYSPSILQFEADTTTNHVIDSNHITYIFQTTANICDESGNLLFFSNGMCLFNKDGDTIENAFGFHPPQLSAFYNEVANSSQAALILPKGNGLYYYFYYSMSDDNYTHNRPFDLLCYSIVDMNANNGKGKVVSKNNFLLQGISLAPYGLTTCRHANGRDWWVIMPEIIKNAYYVFNVTPDTINTPDNQVISTSYFGTVTPHGQCVFSNNGNYLATTNFDGGIRLMQFDRCSGIISPWHSLTVPYDTATQYGIGANGVAFSASDSFLYANTFKKVYQIDLSANNIQQSVIEVGKEDSGNYVMFDQMQIAPNGKIYVGNFNGHINTYSIVNEPEVKDTLCKFSYHSDTIKGSVVVIGVPNMPNYHLGTLVGSGCDTIVNSIPSISESEGQVQIIVNPNPASSMVRVTVSGAQGVIQLAIYNTLGEAISITQINEYAELSVTDLPNGVYYYAANSNQTIFAKGKLVVQH